MMMIEVASGWISPPPSPSLSPTTVHLWRARLNLPPAEWRALEATLSADERERAARLRRPDDRRRFIAGRGTLRRILACYLRCAPQAVRFAYGPQGKPSLAGGEGDLRFNLSHSHDLALYVFARGRSVGVDVERVRRLPDAERMAARFFSAREQADFAALPDAQKAEGFFHCWTRKEAYLKALGEGITRPLDAFDVTLRPGDPPRLRRVSWNPAEADRWALVSLSPAPGYVAALAVEESQERLSVVCFVERGDYADRGPR